VFSHANEKCCIAATVNIEPLYPCAPVWLFNALHARERVCVLLPLSHATPKKTENNCLDVDVFAGKVDFDLKKKKKNLLRALTRHK